MSNLFARWESIPQSYLAPSLYVADIAQYRRRCCGGPAVLSSNCEMMRNQLYRTKRGEAWCEIRRLHSEPFGSSVGAPSSPSFFLEAYITVHESRHTHANFNTIPYSGPKAPVKFLRRSETVLPQDFTWFRSYTTTERAVHVCCIPAAHGRTIYPRLSN
jgi:hypothetical protein